MAASEPGTLGIIQVSVEYYCEKMQVNQMHLQPLTWGVLKEGWETLGDIQHIEVYCCF